MLTTTYYSPIFSLHFDDKPHNIYFLFSENSDKHEVSNYKKS